ncbi:MAG: hypothetical protein R3B40_13780 [Polyangiales bacterium]
MTRESTERSAGPGRPIPSTPSAELLASPAERVARTLDAAGRWRRRALHPAALRAARGGLDAAVLGLALLVTLLLPCLDARADGEVLDPWADRDAPAEEPAPDSEAADAGVAAAEAPETEAGEAEAETPAPPSEVKIGMYINRLRDVNLRDGTFVVDFWMWFRWQNDDLHPAQTFELVNGEIQNRIDSEVVDDLGYHYTSVRLVATIYHVFDVDHFPYDNHTLHIDIEDVESESVTQFYTPDTANSRVDPLVQVAGWDVSLGETSAADHIYDTNYGFLSLGENAHAPYSRFTQKIELRRGTGMPLLKLFWVTFLSVMLGLLALRVHVTDLDARFGLSVGSIFAAMANTYVLGEILPETEAITMAEQMNFLGVGTIFGAVFISIASIRLVYAGREQASRKLDWWAFVGLATLYVIANIVVVRLHG